MFQNISFYRVSFVVAAVALFGFGCTQAVQNTDQQQNTNANTTTQQESQEQAMQENTNPESMSPSASDTRLAVTTADSSIQWTGYKIIPKSTHFGTINFADGEVFINDENEITAGTFVVDMTTIVDEDLENESMNERLVNHLKSEDFFNVTEYPTAQLELTQVVPLEGREDGVTHQVAANLTIKGITHNVTFPATITVENGILNAQATVEFDRTLWDVRFGTLKFGPDAIVEDDITLDVAVVAEAQ